MNCSSFSVGVLSVCVFLFFVAGRRGKLERWWPHQIQGGRGVIKKYALFSPAASKFPSLLLPPSLYLNPFFIFSG